MYPRCLGLRTLTEATPPGTGVVPTRFPRRCKICFCTETRPLPRVGVHPQRRPPQTSGGDAVSVHRSLPTLAPQRPFPNRCS